MLYFWIWVGVALFLLVVATPLAAALGWLKNIINDDKAMMDLMTICILWPLATPFLLCFLFIEVCRILNARGKR